MKPDSLSFLTLITKLHSRLTFPGYLAFSKIIRGLTAEYPATKIGGYADTQTLNEMHRKQFDHAHLDLLSLVF